MNDFENRLERIENAVLEIAESIEDGEYFNLHARVGSILFDTQELTDD